MKYEYRYKSNNYSTEYLCTSNTCVCPGLGDDIDQHFQSVLSYQIDSGHSLQVYVIAKWGQGPFGARLFGTPSAIED